MNAIFANIFQIFCFTALFIFMVPHAKNTKMTKTFSYNVTYGSPTGNYTHLGVKSAFLDENKQILTQFSPIGAGNLPLGDGTQVTAIQNRKVPTYLRLQWISYNENKFYQGTFKLPTDLIEDRFSQTMSGRLFMRSRDKTSPVHSKFVINVAPDGKVYLYLGGSVVKLIGTYQAQQTNYDWKDWQLSFQTSPEMIDAIKKGYFEYSNGEKEKINTRNERVAEVLNNNKNTVKQAHLSYKLGYFDQASFKLSLVDNLNHSTKLTGFNTKTLNGENSYFFNPENAVVNNIPKQIIFYFEQNKKEKLYKFVFPNLYTQLKKHFDFNKTINIIIDVSSDDEVSTFFKQGDISFEVDDFYAEDMTD